MESYKRHALADWAFSSSAGVISGTPIVNGTFNFTVQVEDSSTPNPQTASANLSITINPGATTNSRLSGNYAFSVRGFDANGLFVAAGSFFADGNGNITAGLMDINNTAASHSIRLSAAHIPSARMGLDS